MPLNFRRPCLVVALSATVLAIGRPAVASPPAPVGTWTYHDASTTLQYRTVAQVVYDAARKKVVLFGGSNGWNYQNDTWEWDGASWTQTVPDTSSSTPVVGPPGRGFSALFYDVARKKTFLFGGQDEVPHYLSDFWAYGGAAWQDVGLPDSGTTITWRSGSALAYDSKRNVTLLFGGEDNGLAGDGSGWLDDTWQFDGITWTKLVTTGTPPKRSRAGLAYDAYRDEFVLFGGRNTYPTTTDLDDTWYFDPTTKTWKASTPPQKPPAREGFAITYDPTVHRVVVFGGTQATGPDTAQALSDTWLWSGKTWTQVSYAPATNDAGKASPDPRGGVWFAFDEAHGVSVTSNGYDPDPNWGGAFGDTWTLKLDVPGDDGTQCTAADKCASGICASGVCCATDCAGSCATCADPAHLGVCWQITTGACGGNAVCNDAGTASIGPNGESACGNYACGAASGTCFTSCGSSADCASAFVCVGGACVTPEIAPSATDWTSGCAVREPAGGAALPVAGLALGVLGLARLRRRRR